MRSLAGGLNGHWRQFVLRRNLVLVTGTLAVLLLSFAVLTFMSWHAPFLRPAGVPPGAVNGGSILEPGRWIWCQSSRSPTICQRYYANGGNPETVGLYVIARPEALHKAYEIAKLNPTTLSARILDLYSTEDFAAGNYYIRQIGLVAEPSDMWGGAWTLWYRDPNCISALLEGNSEKYAAAYATWSTKGELDLLRSTIASAKQAGILTPASDAQHLRLEDSQIAQGAELHVTTRSERREPCEIVFSFDRRRSADEARE